LPANCNLRNDASGNRLNTTVDSNIAHLTYAATGNRLQTMAGNGDANCIAGTSSLKPGVIADRVVCLASWIHIGDSLLPSSVTQLERRKFKANL
jgi:hypothetical protein